MEKQTCEKCGATLAAPGATCRRCLMELAASWKPEPSESVTTKAPRPAPPPELGELAPLFPELEIESLLGAGGMGAVYKAKQKRLGRAVALKVLHGELSGDPLFVERFLREAQALAKLAHPGIVAIHDFGEREKRCYLVMEYVDGTNLRALLKQKLLAPSQALHIVRQLCDALQFAHDEGVVHRDIKPENVLVDTAGKVKIADFGLAKLVGAPAQLSLTSANQVMGTPHYMAPEQVERPRDVDHRADLYSLGVVFYEMLTGELPLGRFQAPSERVQIDVRLDEIVLKSLERERERRYQHAVQVKTDVERVEREPAAPAARPKAKVADDEADAVRVEGPKFLLGFRMGRRGTPGKTMPLVEVHGTFAWLLAFCATWFGAALAFNGGSLLFLFFVLFLFGALLYGFYLERRAPEALAAWKARGKGERFARGFASVTLVFFGALGLFAGHVAMWERGTDDYAPPPQNVEDMLAAARWFNVLVVPDPPLELQTAFAQTNPYGFAGLPPFAVLASCVVLLVLGLRGLDPRRRRGASDARPWRPAMRVVFIALLPLLCWDCVQLFGGARASLPVTANRPPVKGTASDVTSRFQAGLLEQGYFTRTEVFLRAAPGAAWVRANGHLLASAPASPLDTWRVGWSGPERTRPAVYLGVVESADGFVLADARIGTADPSSPHLDEWRQWLTQLLDRATAQN